ncbi:MAG: DNA polymerase beta domain-containing protein [Candidatus Berkelbacteria bacterium Licking1014_85]|uniref:DNA polymerase beta domain-containing protein n=1 Tax=Candidatus Berkelbacteria bacterium Licking1014_85 TaxID=2017148 RepID=A0A554LHQ9_9BACT|nr:MAG: DNA polymerase beta domain-containing protein [Candidatus Berkelbacteria bacterium Licking1014_85]
MATKKVLDQSVKTRAKKYRDLLEKSGVKIKTLYVFGSYAKGKARKWSDIDVAVVSSDFKSDRHDERVRLMDYSDQIDDFIEPHPFTPEEFEDKYYPLAREVKRTGIKIE